VPVPDPAVWAFDDSNDTLFSLDNQKDPIGPVITAEEWVRKGTGEIQHELQRALELERVKSHMSRKSRRSRKGAMPEDHGHGHHHAEGHAATGQAGAAGAAGGGAAGETGGDVASE